MEGIVFPDRDTVPYEPMHRSDPAKPGANFYFQGEMTRSSIAVSAGGSASRSSAARTAASRSSKNRRQELVPDIKVQVRERAKARMRRGLGLTRKFTKMVANDVSATIGAIEVVAVSSVPDDLLEAMCDPGHLDPSPGDGSDDTLAKARIRKGGRKAEVESKAMAGDTVDLD